MRILIIGQCTVHWGRMEYGNVGNYYILETSVRELHRVFPEAEIVTTFQLTESFCIRENIKCLPMELFYSWGKGDLPNAIYELGIATLYQQTGRFYEKTAYIEAVQDSDLIIDFSGEMWGDHAEPVGKNRFLVGLIKDRIAQLLNKPVVLLAGSQGPFSDTEIKEFAKLVFKNFSLVSNRESSSYELLQKEGFDVSRVKNFSCPAFLFEPQKNQKMELIYNKEKIKLEGRSTVGFILCGFNFLEGPYDKWPRPDEEYDQFAEAIEYIVNELGARVILMSHQNGFNLPPDFKLINGRDYPIVKQLQKILYNRGNVDSDEVLCVDSPYLPGEVKAIIGQFDMFVTGRVHAFVASVSQYVPTVLITRGFGPESHRNIGFARVVGLDEYIASPKSSDDIKMKIKKCWDNRREIKEILINRIPSIQEEARQGFAVLRDIIASDLY